MAFVDVSTGEFQLYEIKGFRSASRRNCAHDAQGDYRQHALPENATTLHVDVQDGARFNSPARVPAGDFKSASLDTFGVSG
ncbi:MAG: hypothetical protein ACLUI3_02965 [Christensenellales bacterium]